MVKSFKEVELPQFYDAQAEILNSLHKFIIFVAGRRSGKTFVLHWLLIIASLSFPDKLSTQSPQMVVGALPTLKQAKPILWEPLVSLFEGELKDFLIRIDRSRNVIYPHVNGTPKPPIVIAGANDHNGDRLRGLRMYFLAADEFQDWKPTVFNLICRPSLADTPGSRAFFSGTPKGKLNALYKMFERASKFPRKYRAFQLRSIDNPFGMSLAEIEEMRKTLPPRQFRQEVEGSFEDFEGKVFSELDTNNIVTHIPVGKKYVTVMGVDWGDINPAIVVWRKIESKWYLLESWVGNFSTTSRSGSPVTMDEVKREALRLATKYDVDNVYCDPSRPANILDLRGLGNKHRQKGLRRALAGYNPIQEGLDYLHSLIFQKKLLIYDSGIVPESKRTPLAVDVYELFGSYRRAINRDGVVMEEVEQGQIDDLIDATRYALVPALSDKGWVTGDEIN